MFARLNVFAVVRGEGAHFWNCDMINSIHVDLENCYGIKKLEHSFPFANGPNAAQTTVIYSANGSMKTSFSKTFKDLQEGKASKDAIFEDREPKRVIQKNDGADLTGDEVFVILSMNRAFRSDQTSSLLVSSEMKKKYDSLTKEINQKKAKLIFALQKSSGVKSDVVSSFLTSVNQTGRDFVTILKRYRDEASSPENPALHGIKITDISNPAVDSFLKVPENSEAVSEYSKTYKSLLEDSLFFRSGVFDLYNAETIATNLEKNGFFKHGHQVIMIGDNENVTVSNKEELVQLIEKEKAKIISDEELKKKFENVHVKLNKNASLRSFRDTSTTKPGLIAALADPATLKEALWIEYFKENKTQYLDFLDTFAASESEIEAIIAQAKLERPRWKSVVEEYNRRFTVPFRVEVKNQEDVMLKEAVAELRFEYVDQDTGESRSLSGDDLNESLSTGESRAFYILNIIFEIKAREDKGQPTLFVIDDIADSFDYKNKYAIVQYLDDIQNIPHFKLIILTHNFDFYRTVQGRLGIWGPNRYVALRGNSEIILAPNYIKDEPFKKWKTQLERPSVFVACIPFVRNIAEYLLAESQTAFSIDDHIDTLTNALHVKPNEDTTTVGGILQTYEDILGVKTANIEHDLDENIQKFILRTALQATSIGVIPLPLEEKICLSIGIRIIAEKIMTDILLANNIDINQLGKNRTGKLIKKICAIEGQDPDLITTLKEVGLMTPENIHLNSFMFEPILDLSAGHLTKLFHKISQFSDIEIS